MAKKIILIILVTLFLVGCSFEDNDENTFTGTIEGNRVSVSSEISGKIVEINYQEGNKILEGDNIAVIDTEDLALKLNKAEKALELSKAKLQEAINGARNEEIRSLKANLNKIEVQLEGAKRNYEHRADNYNKMLKLHENSAVSKQELDDAEVLLDNELTKINSLEKEYEGMKAKLDLLIVGATDQKIKMLEAEVEMGKVEIEMIQKQIEKGRVASPINGTVQSINFNKGELITTGGELAAIIEDNNLWVKIYIPEKDLHKISLDDKLSLMVDFIESENIVGQVIYISSEGEFTPKNIESKENKKEMVFEVKIKIVDGIEQLKPGMLVDVMLEGDV